MVHWCPNCGMRVDMIVEMPEDATLDEMLCDVCYDEAEA